MPVRRHTLTLATTAPIQFIDLSDALRAWVRDSGVLDGLLTVTSPHTTARITRNERETELQGDMVRFLEHLAPADAAYRHNRNTVDGRANAHSHLLGLLMPASESIPVVGGELSMGGWQSVFFVELDGPRESREVHLQLIVA
jgi:secondary thiamine-phosphate synthase enzyme